MKRICFLFFFCLLLALSCSRESDAVRTVSPLASSMIKEPVCPETAILKRYGAADRSGSIALVGQPEDCMLLCGELVNCDVRDNYSGEPVSDGLKDFAGEVVSCIMIDSPEVIPQPEDTVENNRVRDYTIRQVLASMDTLCFVSSFDKKGTGVKSRPKLIVLASTFCADENGGYFDIDSLFRYYGCSIPVFCPFDAAVKSVLENGAKVIGVIGTENRIAAGVYDGIIENCCRAMGVKAECYAFSPATGETALTSFLTEYISSGHTDPVDVLIFDSYSKIGFEENDALLKINSVLTPESVVFSDFISKSFKFVGLRDFAGKVCYDCLRSGNLFTHNIAQPVSESFSAHQDSTLSAGLRLEYFRMAEGK